MNAKTGTKGREAILSVAIDPLLIEGGRKVSEIADVLKLQFGETYTKARLINNIRSRVVALQDKGYTLEKSGRGGIVKLVAPQPASVASI